MRARIASISHASVWEGKNTSVLRDGIDTALENKRLYNGPVIEVTNKRED